MVMITHEAVLLMTLHVDGFWVSDHCCDVCVESSPAGVGLSEQVWASSLSLSETGSGGSIMTLVRQ